MPQPYLRKVDLKDLKLSQSYLCKSDGSFFISKIYLNTEKQKYVEDTAEMMVLAIELQGAWQILEIPENDKNLNRKELIDYSVGLTQEIKHVVGLLKTAK